MKFCTKCGAQLDEGASFCPSCGARADGTEPYMPPQPQYNNTEDSPSFLYALLGFLFPIVGLILYLVMHDTQPKRAASAGKGALIGFISSIVFGILIVVITVIVTSMFVGGYAFLPLLF